MTIFLFKRRLVQIRLCAVELVLLIGAGAMMGIYFYLCNRYFADSEFYSHTLKISLVFPLVCLVFDLLALRAIFRDESWCGRSTGFADRTYFSEKGVRSKLHAFLCLFCRERIRFGGVFDTK